MKSISLTVIICSLSILTDAQQESKPLPQRTVNVNLAGLLQMGPIVQSEFRLGKSKSYIAPHVRIPYAGLIYQLRYSEKFQTTVSPVALGLGLQYKRLVPSGTDVWYWGAGGDYSSGGTSGKDQLIGEWKGKHNDLWLMVNVGARWRKPDQRRVISLGLLLGPNLALREERWYKSDPSNRTDSRENYLLAMVELSIGWEK